MVASAFLCSRNKAADGDDNGDNDNDDDDDEDGERDKMPRTILEQALGTAEPKEETRQESDSKYSTRLRAAMSL